MDEQQFWKIIALFDWAQLDDLSIMRPAIEHLAQLRLDDLREFEEILAQKLYTLDTKAHARATGFGYEDFSVDAFLYIRCGVVSRGRAFYERVLNNPFQMSDAPEFGSLLYMVWNAAEQRGVGDFRLSTRVSYETFSNRDGWKNAVFSDDAPSQPHI